MTVPVAVPLLCLVALLAVLSMRQAHHPREARGEDRLLAYISAALGLVVLVIALTQVVALTRL